MRVHVFLRHQSPPDSGVSRQLFNLVHVIESDCSTGGSIKRTEVYSSIHDIVTVILKNLGTIPCRQSTYYM